MVVCDSVIAYYDLSTSDFHILFKHEHFNKVARKIHKKSNN